MIALLALIGAAIGGLVWIWLHDWETKQTLSMKVQERERKE